MMGDVAEQIIEGLLCQTCGAFIDGEMPGYPRDCPMCDGHEDDWQEERETRGRDR